MTKTYQMNSLIEKMQSPDQDFRFMGLNDLMTEIKQDPQCFLGDETVENKVLKQVLALVEDKISEVKNQAVKCLGQLIKIIRQVQMELVVDKLIEFSGGKDQELRDISALALKTITAELPPDGRVAASACAKLTPKLLAQIQSSDTPSEALVETLAILSILISRFPSHLSASSLTPHPLAVLVPLLSHPRPVVRKRAIVTLSQFITISPPELFSELFTDNVLPYLGPSANIEKQRTTVNLVAAVARHSPSRLAPMLSEIMPGIVKAVQREDDELREGCLQALEILLLRCPAEIGPYVPSIVQVGNQYIKYDPIRRSATKLLAALIGTRPEMLSTIYKDVSPVLISRFGDREETVKLEVWSTYGLLLSQTAVYGGLSQSKEDVTRGKRKRDTETMDVEGGPYSLLKSQVPALSKALLNQLKSQKTSSGTLQAGFGLLYSLLNVLPGSLSSQVTSITSTSRRVLSTSPSTSTATLYLNCLSFLALFFATHSPPIFTSSLPSLTPALLKAAGERHPRVASEAFRVFSALLQAVKPVKNADWTEPLYDQAVARLTTHDTDAEVRGCAEECIGDLWICATDVVRSKNGKEWESICRQTGKVDGAVKVIIKVAKEVNVGDAWVNGCMDWILGLLKKSGRPGKSDIFLALEVLIRSYTTGVPSGLPSALISQIKPYLSVSDISLLSQALSTLSVLLELAPSTTFPEVEAHVLSDIYAISRSPLVGGTALDSLLNFYAALVKADKQIATHIVPSLVISVDKVPKAESSPANAARCVAQVVKTDHSVAAGTIAEYSKHVKPSSKAKQSTVVLSLLILGELGRFIDMSPQHDIFTNAIEHFSAEQEDVRSAASFAAGEKPNAKIIRTYTYSSTGNIAIGNLHQFLPAIVKMVQSDAKKRLLSLHALKENRIHDSSPAARATVVAAIRYTFADTAPTYDELLSPLIIDFLSLMGDADLTVRRLALSTLNSAARTKSHLIRDHLSVLLPNLYKETVINKDLIRTVQMGPWTHKVDDGLEARKTAYETMYTLLDTCLHKLDLREFLERVVLGLADDSDEIKVICHMLLFRLAQVAPAAVSQRLDEATPQLEKTMKGATVTKDTVKQDLERAAELQRSALRAVAALSKIGAGVSPKFDAFTEDLKKNSTWGAEFKELIG
ncbi:hypothetical protein HHX47_DHR9000534 [Lentinula edodes]|nr:hypothetical protein HHX47_DHR9000534 [Lentinula edodes]